MELKFRGKGAVEATDDLWSVLPRHTAIRLNTAGYVFVLNRKAPPETKTFLLTSLLDNKLQVSLISSPEDHHHLNDDIIFLVTCDSTTLQQFAKHVYMPQQLRRQNVVSGSLSVPEQERVLLHILETIIQKDRSKMIGLEKVTIYPGQSIVQICHREQVILHYFPLHQADTLKVLKANWCSSFVNDIDSVRDYFGEKIGFYFSFLNFYSAFFMFSSITCLFSYAFGHVFLVNESITILLCIGLFVFLKLWKRNSNRLACKWGTIEAFELENARPAFRSKGMHRDPVTEELVPFYPITKTWCKEYLISVPFVLCSLYLSFEVMCLYFESENWAIQYYNNDPSLLSTVVSYCPSIIYALIVMTMNHLYRLCATKLNDYENHRTQTSHENHWIVKLVLFEFVNNFMSLFYIAFYLKDINMLKWNLITMLTINQVVDNLLETVLPLSSIYLSSRSRGSNKKSHLTDDLAQIHYEKDLCEYEDTYYDYLELFIQYGYAFLFVSIFPLAPAIAFLNSLIEIRLDAIKLCVAMRKPRQRSAKCINNAWMKSFEVISMLVVITNLLVLSIVSQPVQELSAYFNLSNFEFIIYIEHLIFLLILLVWYIVPDIPKEVNFALTRQKYHNIKEVTGLQMTEKTMATDNSLLN